MLENQPKENKCIMLVEGVHMNDSTPVATFTGIPVSDNCPYIELIFDPTTGILGIVSKHHKQLFHWVPRVSEDGMQIPVKDRVAVAAGLVTKQQRIQIDSYHEYYIRNVEEIKSFLDKFVVNSDFDYQRYFPKTKKKK